MALFCNRNPGTQRGFTLVEALVAVVILAMIGGLTFGAFARAMQTRQRVFAITQQQHQIRQALLRMAREISMAFLSVHKDCVDPRTSTLFIGKRATYGMRLDFTSFSHFKMRAHAKESDQNELGYFIEADSAHPDQTRLMRREKMRIDENAGSGGVVQMLAPHVSSLEFTFYDAKNDRWQDSWDSTQLEYKGRLPKFVSIKLISRDDRQKEQVFVTKTRVFLKEAISIPGAGFSPCID